MSTSERLKANPRSFDLFKVLRELEKTHSNKPRIGDSTTLSEDIVVLGQNPYMDFPDSNIDSIDATPTGTMRIQTRFLGYFGPQGALPIHMTERAYAWLRGGDPAFARFVDIFSSRFLQLFYRAWADARPIAQFERPQTDPFMNYIGAFAGIGSPAFRDQDSNADIAKIPFSGLANAQVKSASRLNRFLRSLFGVSIEVEEWVGTWLPFAPEDCLALGKAAATLGEDTFVGKRVFSINEKIRIRIKCLSLKQYEEFLPGGAKALKLGDAVFFYMGLRQEFDVELGLEATKLPQMRLGQTGKLGWTSWVAPLAVNKTEVENYRFDARYDPFAQTNTA
jgi:type VI secretion system protein ImpH